MTIQDWGAFGELVGGVAVIVTLIYLAFQIRQNTRAIRLSTSHAVTEDFRNTFALMAEQIELADAIHKGSKDPRSISGAEKMRYWGFNHYYLYAFENAYVESAQKVTEQAFSIIRHSRPDTFASDRLATFEFAISVIAALQGPFYTAQKRSSTGSADPSPGRCC